MLGEGRVRGRNGTVRGGESKIGEGGGVGALVNRK